VTKRAQDVVDDIKSLPDTEKLAVVDSILLELDRPDPEIDRVWANEARARWQAYRSDRADHVPYAAVMRKHRRKCRSYLTSARSRAKLVYDVL
jgi:hypothetical protein